MKRAAYRGPHRAIVVRMGDGVEIEVENGHQLPTEYQNPDGETVPVPAALRDELLDRDDWSEVKQTPAPKKDDA